MFDPASDWSLIFWAGRVRCRGASSLVGHLNAISPFVRTLCRVTDVAVTDTISVAVERFVAKPVATENMDSRLLSNGGSL
jgi:hypothetical protein